MPGHLRGFSAGIWERKEVWLTYCRICMSGFMLGQKEEKKKVSNWAKTSSEPIVQNCTRPTNVFFFFLWITCWFFFGVQQGQWNAEQQGNLNPFLSYANNSKVLPALLANTAVNANQTICAWLQWALCRVTCQGNTSEGIFLSFTVDIK